MHHESGDGDFLSVGAGAAIALVLLAILLKLTGISVQGWIRFAVIPVYVLLLCLCTWVVDRLRRKEK